VLGGESEVLEQDASGRRFAVAIDPDHARVRVVGAADVLAPAVGGPRFDGDARHTRR